MTSMASSRKPRSGSRPSNKSKQEAGRRGGRRGRGRVKEKLIENKKEEFAELMKSLGQLVGSYAHLPPDKMQAFAQNATVAQAQGERGDQVGKGAAGGCGHRRRHGGIFGEAGGRCASEPGQVPIGTRALASHGRPRHGDGGRRPVTWPNSAPPSPSQSCR